MASTQQFSMARGYTFSRIKQADDSAWNTQPEGFSNTIHWNAGHIYISAEDFVKKALPEYEMEHAEWAELYAPGTNPSSWPADIPSKDEVMNALKGQAARILKCAEGKLDQRLETPISLGDMITMETVDEVLQFLIFHEAIHAGLIDGLTKAVK